MKKDKSRIIVFLITTFLFTHTFAQTERRSVYSSHITEKYNSAVKKGFYNEMNSAISTGYHGFADFGYTIGFGDYKLGRFELSSTHGYQINPYLFIGAGLGIQLMSEYETPGMDIPLDYRDFLVDVPIYANVRLTVIDGPISPFIDGKCGYYLTHHGALYLNASVGCRFSTWGKQAVNVYIGYSNENLEFKTFDRFYSSNNMDYNRDKRNLATEGLTIKLGYEF